MAERDYVVVQQGAKQVLRGPGEKNWLYYPEFTDSWHRRPLYSLAKWVNGLAFRDIQFSTVGKPVIKIAEIKGGISGQTKFTGQTFDDSVLVRPDDLLFSWSGQPETSIDAFWWHGPEGWLNQHVFRVTTGADVDRTFFYYLLRYLKPNFVGIARNKQTTGLGHVTKHDLETMEVGLPPLLEQRAIAHVLGTLDDKIELNRRMNETLEEIARALFKSWFVDFDPVRAKMEGRWRRGESLPGLPADLYDLFPDRLVDSELGEIPEGWEVKAFGELLDDVIGGDWGKDSPDPINSECVSIIRGTDLPNLRNGGIGAVPFRYTTEKKVKRRMLQDGDIVIEVSGGSPTQSTGRSMIMTRDLLARFPAAVVCASFCRRFRPRSWTEGLLAYQNLNYLHSVEKMWEYQLQSTGISNFQTKRFLEEELILWPNDSLAMAYSDILSPIVRRMTSNESKTLAETRDSLLPRLVSGEIGFASR